MPPLDTTLSATDEAADLRNALKLLSPQEQAAIMGGGVGDEASDELTVINELANNGDKEARTITADDLPAKNEGTGDGNDLANDDGEDDDEQARLDAEGADQQAVAEAAAQLAREQAAAAAAQAQPQDFAFTEPVYVPVPPPVADYDERLQAIQSERAEAQRLLLAGELDEAEFSAKDSKTLTDLMALNNAQNRHVAAVEQNEAIATEAWQRDVATVKAIAKTEGIDYDADPQKMKALDSWCKQLASDDANADKPASFFIKEAHKMVKLQYNSPDVVQEQSKSQADKAQAAKPPVTRQNRAPDLSQIPPTLAHAPAAAIESEGDTGEFAHIDKLQGIAQEQALARLTPEQQERYLQG